ncbi:RHS repeat-associated core domain-containing protein, partial [Pseudobutyrivibrio sp.]|uniref:RHS repeat-associated core domain-containing protein n=1 Tax=Pseudobutyrivibrio sp. TaxID=2014367 RepID=UPI00386956C1
MQFYPIVFTGKERDEETGYHYFGARYYWSSVLTGWLSVDPMADKYPSISPYSYCAWNPMKLVDPDGNEAMDNDDWYKNKETGAVLWQEGHDKQIKCGGDTYENIGESYSAP